MLPSPDSLKLGEALARRSQRLIVVEAGAGGSLQAELSAQPGASRWFCGGVVCYADSLKTGLLQLDPQVLIRHGAVSAPTVRSLAHQALRLSDADWALAETGVYGPAGGSPEKPVGLVYLHVAYRGAGDWPRMLRLSGTRASLRSQTSAAAVQALLGALRAADQAGLAANLE